jgi:hypothetical protein
LSVKLPAAPTVITDELIAGTYQIARAVLNRIELVGLRITIENEEKIKR